MLRGVTLALASAGGLGYLPLAPGTWGTLAALPLWWAGRKLGWPVFAAGTLAVILVAVVVCQRAERYYGDHDVQHIVLDEVAGMLTAVIGVPFTGPSVVAAFVLFRVLDATKPFPISWVDHNVGGGLGVVLDDVVAGLGALLILHTVQRFSGVLW